MSKVVPSKSAAYDKYIKLKDRKKFKRMKLLQKKKNVLKNSEYKVTKPLGEDNNSLKGKQSDKNRVETLTKTRESDAKQSKHTVISNKKKAKSIQWKQKQMVKKLERKNKSKKDSQKDITGGKGEVHVPTTLAEATANWQRLQQVLSDSKHKSSTRKRKIPVDKIRNPKLRKTGEGVNAGESKAIQNMEPEIWFDDVDEILLDRKHVVSMAAVMEGANDNAENSKVVLNPLVKPGAYKGLTKIVCMDCEMVGVGDGTDSMLARVSIVNQYGEPIYDKFVKPKEDVMDYRTPVSGVRPSDLKDAEEFEQVQREVAEILKGRTLVGHAIKHDLKVLYMSHPKQQIRDTSMYKQFKQLTSGRTPSLKKLSEKILGVKVQEGEHNSIQDAQATMRLYTMYRKQWEREISEKHKSRKMVKGGKRKT